MKKGLLAVIAMLCVASVMAAFAYTSATVTNASTLTVANTNNALLALTADNATIGHKDLTAAIGADGKLSFNFGKGKDGAIFGLQKNSAYTWNSLFDVKNNSTDNVSVKVKYPSVPAGVVISAKVSGTNVWTTLTNDNTSFTFDLNSGVKSSIDVKVEVNDNATVASVVGNIVIESDAK
ncbi:hypothetical protein [Paenibacillus sp. MBLB4367]|uniref:hypothetical protein n=1 Tax=Paenibacillus sp. MBLB4367 TaxID=3384767 RepID=UPI0039083491